MRGNQSGFHYAVIRNFCFFLSFLSLAPYLPSLFSLSEDEAFELCLGLQTLLELKVRSSFALLIFLCGLIMSLLVCAFQRARNEKRGGGKIHIGRKMNILSKDDAKKRHTVWGVISGKG